MKKLAIILLLLPLFLKSQVYTIKYDTNMVRYATFEDGLFYDNPEGWQPTDDPTNTKQYVCDTGIVGSKSLLLYRTELGSINQRYSWNDFSNTSPAGIYYYSFYMKNYDVDSVYVYAQDTPIGYPDSSIIAKIYPGDTQLVQDIQVFELPTSIVAIPLKMYSEGTILLDNVIGRTNRRLLLVKSNGKIIKK